MASAATATKQRSVCRCLARISKIGYSNSRFDALTYEIRIIVRFPSRSGGTKATAKRLINSEPFSKRRSKNVPIAWLGRIRIRLFRRVIIMFRPSRNHEVRNWRRSFFRTRRVPYRHPATSVFVVRRFSSCHAFPPPADYNSYRTRGPPSPGTTLVLQTNLHACAYMFIGRAAPVPSGRTPRRQPLY